MHKRGLNNKDLDKIGKKLFESTRSGGTDIDEIVSNARLYDMVRARIAANVENPDQEAFRRLGFNWRYAAVGAIMMIVTAGAAMLLLTGNKPNSSSALVVEQVPEVIPVSQARPDHPPKPMFSKLPSGRAFQVSKKANALRSINKKIESRPKPEQEHIPQNEFYALSFAGDMEETAAGGRIIRVDMPRSSLFAMGVDVPLENGRDMVKTDLLIGSDGMTRAVRVVE